MAERPKFFGPIDSYPTWLKDVLGIYGPKGMTNPKTVGKAWLEIHKLILEQFRTGRLQVTDQDDLDHRILVTFPVWLRSRLCDELLRAIKGMPDRELAMAAIHALRSGEALDERRAAKIWEYLVGAADTIAQRLVPLRRTWINDREKVDRVCGLHVIDPTNPVDLAARLTRVTRFRTSGHALDEIPAEYRQNHPSFRGRLCPVESPESEQVGLTLQLAQGATVDVEGRIHPAPDDRPLDELGFGAGLVPFYQHNDGARSMMGAKNLRQALPIAGRTASLVKTGGERLVVDATRDLAGIGLCANGMDQSGELALGKDLLVAYIPWDGMNFEDAIVVGQHVVDSEAMDVILKKTIQRDFDASWEPRSPDRFAVFEGEKGGLAIPGQILTAGSLIASMSRGAGLKPREIRYHDRSPAVLKNISFTKPQAWMGGKLTYELEKNIPLGLGDKLMGRHGNKGVVGSILPIGQMPHLPDDPALPERFRGRPIDILLNPHGVISRMNLGQLLETHVGWLLNSGLCKESDLRRPGAAGDRPLGYPFETSLDHGRVRSWLKKSGLDDTGRIQLVLPSGERTLSPVVVGFQHIVRLRHIPELKAQARRGGPGALYSRKAGQAVHGRIRGGGQRVGEMEVWALAGHKAEHIIEEMLGGKADAAWARHWLSEDHAPRGNMTSGFPALLQDWLFAALIRVDIKNGMVRFAIASAEDIERRIEKGREVVTGDSIAKLITASFQCHGGKKDAPCGYNLPSAGRIAVSASPGKDGQISSLRVGDYLAHLGLAVEGPLLPSGKKCTCLLKSIASGKDAGKLTVGLELRNDQLKATISPLNPSKRPPGWPKELESLHAYGRFADSSTGGNVAATDLVKDMMDPDGKYTLSDLRITCPHHKSILLKASPPFGEQITPVEGGLFDESIFGSMAGAIDTWRSREWGYIALPRPIRYPLHVFLSAEKSSGDDESKLKEKREKSVRDFLKQAGLGDKDIPTITKIPILPVHYRLPLLAMCEPLDDELVSKGYAPLIELCRQYRVADSEKKDFLTEHIERVVAVLFSLLADGLRGKGGLIRKFGLGRRVDRSARLVVTPNPALQWDEVGIPTGALLELLGDRIKAWLKDLGRSDDLLKVVKASRLVGDSELDLDTWSWWRSSKDVDLLRGAKGLLDDFLREHPDTLILLNRQPSLHRDSFQAFKPKALDPEKGDVIQLCPLACKGFGADFDGDEMVVHLPVSKEAQKEAMKLLPSKNLFSLATGEVLAHFDQDFVMGTYWLNDAPEELQKWFLKALPAKCCRACVGKGRIGKKEGADLLLHLAQEHPDRAAEIIHAWMTAAFQCNSRAGVSFGYYDLLELGKAVTLDHAEIQRLLKDEALLKDINPAIQKAVDQVLGSVVGQQLDWARPGLHFAAMALSGARGQKQSRQLVGARGVLSPGATGFSADPRAFYISSSLVSGMNQSEAFLAAMNARSSMCDKKLGTGHAGDLTRNLVFALWPFTVTSRDCRTKATERSVLSCSAKRGCCARCYGALPDGTLPGIGFPAGLVAAQSIGERGTQLSMQSFHTGQRTFSIGYVREVLADAMSKGYFKDIAGALRFVADLKNHDGKNTEYAPIHDRHFHILWRVIAASPGHSLRSAISEMGPLSRMAYQRQAREVIAAALLSDSSSLAEPAARVLFDLFGARAELAKEVAS